MLFDFWKKKRPTTRVIPTTSPSNPGHSTEFKTAFSNGERSWLEEVNLVKLLDQCLSQAGHQVITHSKWLTHHSGLILQPRLVDMQPEEGGVRTCSTIEISLSTSGPSGFFEYQHSTGDSIATSLLKGFELWEKIDLPVLLDATNPAASKCMAGIFNFPQNSLLQKTRRILYGPVLHFREREAIETSEHDPFCSCCMLTKSFDTFKHLAESDQFYAIRLYTLREVDGTVSSDCRINGEDFEEGKTALCKQVDTWPQAGFEFRKQYVVIQNNP